VYRQPNYKSRATVRRELRDYLAIMLSHDLLADVESETQTGAMVVGMRLIESLEDRRAPLRRNTDAVVADGKEDMPIVNLSHLNADATTVRAIFERVIEQVAQYLFDAFGVNIGKHLALSGQNNSMARRAGGERGDEMIRQRRDIGCGAFERELALVEPRDIQQLADQPRQPDRLLLDDPQAIAEPGWDLDVTLFELAGDDLRGGA
jgi:hypothetical protein